MSKIVQITNVPEALHRKLKVRAADAGQTLSDYLLAELERLAARPTRDEMLTRLHGRKRVTLQTPLGTRVEARLFRNHDEFHSRHLADVEVTQGLRRLVRTGEVSAARAAEAIADLADLDLHRHPHLELLTRAWKLRQKVTAYDAMYIALAEALDAPMVTCDALAKAPGHRARIEVIA